jgi:hypothetical protein
MCSLWSGSSYPQSAHRRIAPSDSTFLRRLLVDYFSHASERAASLPTALLPTMATFLCFGAAGILLLAFWGGREERLASVEDARSQLHRWDVAAWYGYVLALAFSGKS